MAKVYPDGTKPVRGKGRRDECRGKMVLEVLMLSIENLMEVIEFIGKNPVLKTAYKGNSEGLLHASNKKALSFAYVLAKSFTSGGIHTTS